MFAGSLRFIISHVGQIDFSWKLEIEIREFLALFSETNCATLSSKCWIIGMLILYQ